MFDGQQLGEDIVSLVRSFMEREIAPLRAENEALAARLKQLEDKPPPELPAPASLDALWSEIRPEAEEIIAEAVSRAVEALPKPKDGEPGKDAAGIVDALKDSGELVLTLQDGRVIRTGIKDGKDGKKGKDGFSLDDFDVEPVDERTAKLKFTRGDEVHSYELQFPVVIYRGVYKEGEEYQRGDLTTWGGSLWHCDEPTKSKPGTDSWTLAAKKGRDGKDAK